MFTVYNLGFCVYSVLQYLGGLVLCLQCITWGLLDRFGSVLRVYNRGLLDRFGSVFTVYNLGLLYRQGWYSVYSV